MTAKPIAHRIDRFPHLDPPVRWARIIGVPVSRPILALEELRPPPGYRDWVLCVKGTLKRR